MEKNKIKVEDVLYDKAYVCPVCGTNFYFKAVRSGKNRVIKTDFDLKTTYNLVNPTLYECVVCEACGYAALIPSFNRLSKLQEKWIREQIVSKYIPTHYPAILTEKDGVKRYKLALIASEVKQDQECEKAYICLKIAWLYRDLKNEKLELEYLKKALIKFQNSFLYETFPILGLNELTVAYLIATIYYRLKNYKDALQWLSNILVAKNVSPNLKNYAINLKEQIRQENV